MIHMLPVTLNELEPSHIQRLIDSEVAENLMLEYKSELPTDKSAQKKEFLFDIAALANAAGGDIVYGIVDRKGDDNQSTGIADRVAGINLSNVQTETTRLSQLIRDGIAPRLSGVLMQEVSHPDGDLLVIRVPRSWNKPHMVTIDGTNKFFGRAAMGKYPMTVDEIGRAFSEQGELSERIARWRAHRASLIEENRGPTPLLSPVTLLFHAIPASAFVPQEYRQSWRVPDPRENKPYHVPHGGSGSGRYNADGYLSITDIGNRAYGYLQFFRSGIVEYADNYCFLPREGAERVIGYRLERQIVECYEDAINRYRSQGLNGPVYVGFSLVGISDKEFFSTLMASHFIHAPIRVNVFTSPEVSVDVNEPEARPYEKTLLPLVDIMWQVSGRAGSPLKYGGRWDPFTDR
jgi:Putative DNA-binding domain